MADIRLDLSLRQEQKLSTQMVQTMETIAMPAQELNEKIRKEAETNPVLVIKDRSPSYSEFASRYSSATDRRESYSDSSYGEDSDGQQGSWISYGSRMRRSLCSQRPPSSSRQWTGTASSPPLRKSCCLRKAASMHRQPWISSIRWNRSASAPLTGVTA